MLVGAPHSAPGAERPAPLEGAAVESSRPRVILGKEARESTVQAILDASLSLEKRINAIGLAGLAALDEAVPALVTVLKRNDIIDVKVAAVWALREIDDPAAIPVLLQVHSQAVGPSPVLRYDKKISFADAGVELTFPELIEDAIGGLGESILSQYLKIIETPSGSYRGQSPGETDVQRAALAVIVCVGDRDHRAVEAMTRVLNNPPEMYPPDFRESAALGLARVLVIRTKELEALRAQDKVAEEIIESLVKYFLTLDPCPVREYLASALNMARPAYAVTLLTRHFADGSPEPVRLRTIELIGMLRSRESVEALVWALENETNPELRWRAAFGLGLAGQCDMATPALRRALKDSAPEVRRAAITALGRLHSKGAAELIEPALADPDPQTRIAAIRALGMLGDGAATRALLTAAQDKDIIVRATAVAALGGLPGRDSLAAVVRAALDDERQVRFVAMKVLCSIPASDAYVALLGLQSDPDRTIRSQAFNALQLAVQQHPEPLKQALVQVITDPKSPASADACDFANALKAPEIVDALKKAALDPRPAVRASAIRALEQMGGG